MTLRPRRLARLLSGLLAVAILGLTAPALRPTSPATGAEPSPEASAGPSPVLSMPGAPDPSVGPSMVPDAAPPSLAFVPVVDYWSSQRSIALRELRDALAGSHPRFDRVLVAEPHLDALAEALGVIPAETTTPATTTRIARAVGRSRRTLGVVPAAEVTPTVRALAVDGVSLFGGRRTRTLDAWPLTIPWVGPVGMDAAIEDPAEIAVEPFDPSSTWTIAAAGDVMLDREVHRQTVLLKKGPDHPWDGGFARITSRTCCNAFGGSATTVRRAGRKGAVRALFTGADIALVNHEGPAPDDFTYHPHGLRFSFDPSLLVGLRDAGIDLVSLANNHIRDAGSRGVLQTIRNVRRAGIAPVGAGRDEKAARQAACFEPAGVRACFLAYDDVDPVGDAATADRPGAARLRRDAVRKDIRRLRREGADVVVVIPHWGREYVTSVTARQRRQARAMAEAGASVVLGAHSHVVGAMESIDGVPVLYSMGNFIFDLTRFAETLEGVIVEATFSGDRLLQLVLHPTVLVNLSQAHLLDPTRDGRAVLRRMRDASRGLFP
jgi:poly-gamma-glutamate capsule biosynthesis protein CapA/YwtB (metallophosphatase superfamily)